MKALVGALNQEKALVESVIVKTDCETDGSFYSTIYNITYTNTGLQTFRARGEIMFFVHNCLSSMEINYFVHVRMFCAL